MNTVVVSGNDCLNLEQMLMPTVDSGGKFKTVRSIAQNFLSLTLTSQRLESASPSEVCDVAIIGAGPYGLSVAAHLRALGVSFRIFGKPLDTWRAHMPKDMLLKSGGFASSLSAPDPASTLKAYCAARSIEYADTELPVSLDLFLEYADWFRATYVPTLEEMNVTALEETPAGYALTLEGAKKALAHHVVLAVGISWFKHIPEELSGLAPDAISHSFDHRDVSHCKGREVIVAGAGASAIDTAALLHDSGASVRILARDTNIRFHTPPSKNRESWMRRLRKPSSGIGPGWRSLICVELPFLFRLLPEAFRLKIVRRHLGPAPGWFMRKRIEGRVETILGYSIEGARMLGERVLLQVKDREHKSKTLECDHVIAATGYKPDLARVPFMSADLLARIATTGTAPSVSGNFETSQPGLYIVGPAVANSFGPLMRFMTGAEFVAPHIAKHLAAEFGNVPTSIENLQDDSARAIAFHIGLRR